MHYDSICLNGLGCSLSEPAGDRSLGDFFALDYSPTSHRLSIVYDQSAKKPDEAAGRLATPAVLTQNAGPSNGGAAFDLGATPARPALRQASVDPAGDALSAYSALVPPGGTNPTPPKNEAAADLLSATVGPQRDAAGAVVKDGGLSVTMKLADLSPAALQTAMTDTQSASLLWIFRFVNGFTASAASARYQARGLQLRLQRLHDRSLRRRQLPEVRGRHPARRRRRPGRRHHHRERAPVPAARAEGRHGSRLAPDGGRRPSSARACTTPPCTASATPQPTQDEQSFLYPLDNTPGDGRPRARPRGAPSPPPRGHGRPRRARPRERPPRAPAPASPAPSRAREPHAPAGTTPRRWTQLPAPAAGRRPAPARPA